MSSKLSNPIVDKNDQLPTTQRLPDVSDSRIAAADAVLAQLVSLWPEADRREDAFLGRNQNGTLQVEFLSTSRE